MGSPGGPRARGRRAGLVPVDPRCAAGARGCRWTHGARRAPGFQRGLTVRGSAELAAFHLAKGPGAAPRRRELQPQLRAEPPSRGAEEPRSRGGIFMAGAGDRDYPPNSRVVRDRWGVPYCICMKSPKQPPFLPIPWGIPNRDRSEVPRFAPRINRLGTFPMGGAMGGAATGERDADGRTRRGAVPGVFARWRAPPRPRPTGRMVRGPRRRTYFCVPSTRESHATASSSSWGRMPWPMG